MFPTPAQNNPPPMKLYILPKKTLRATQKEDRAGQDLDTCAPSCPLLCQLKQGRPVTEHGETRGMNKTISKYIQQEATNVLLPEKEEI